MLMFDQCTVWHTMYMYELIGWVLSYPWSFSFSQIENSKEENTEQEDIISRLTVHRTSVPNRRTTARTRLLGGKWLSYCTDGVPSLYWRCAIAMDACNAEVINDKPRSYLYQSRLLSVKQSLRNCYISTSKILDTQNTYVRVIPTHYWGSCRKPRGLPGTAEYKFAR
jgi:hypothetical protein